jgi:hypothetical protein
MKKEYCVPNSLFLKKKLTAKIITKIHPKKSPQFAYNNEKVLKMFYFHTFNIAKSG